MKTTKRSHNHLIIIEITHNPKNVNLPGATMQLSEKRCILMNYPG
jgi:hypothetical protein